MIKLRFWILKVTLFIAFPVAGIMISGCSTESDVRVEEVSGTQQMNVIIDSVFENMHPSFAIYDNKRRAEFLAEKLREGQSMGLVFDFAIQKLNAGDTGDAIAVIENVLQNNPRLNEVTTRTKNIHEFLGLCYLRLAEQNNCLKYHSPEACIVPLRGGGIHVEKEPATKALEIFSDLYALEAKDQTKWLMNIAYMALGKYPDDVPSNILVSLPSKREDYSTFPNIAMGLGVDENDLSGGVIADDFNNDGYLDILVSSWGRYGSVKLFINEGPDGFVDRTIEADLDSVYGGLNLKQSDFNNDGWIDFIVLRGAWKPGLEFGIPPNSLFRNNGDGSFTDVTITSGIYSRRPTQSAAWLDYNLDGHIDLFIANETTNSSSQSFPCEFYENQGDGTFVNVASDLNVDYVGYFKGVASGDINNDGRPDLFLSNLDGSNVLLENRSAADTAFFKDVSARAGIQTPNEAFPAWFFDYNQDGNEDIYVATYDSTAVSNQSGEFVSSMTGGITLCEPNALYENQGDGTFIDVSDKLFNYSALSTMGSNYGDINNSGFPDFYLGTGAPDFRAIVPNRLFFNQSGSKFEDVTFATHTGHIQKGHGVAFADFNNNGKQDIYAVLGGAYSGDVFHNVFYENAQASGNWIKFKLIGKKSNRAGLGAKLKVVGSSSAGEKLIRYATVSSGSSFGGNPTEVHLGLDNMENIEIVEVRWPHVHASVDTFSNLAINSRYIVVEGNSIKESERYSFSYPLRSNEHNHEHPM